MSTTNGYYLRSFHREVNLHVSFKPLTFPRSLTCSDVGPSSAVSTKPVGQVTALSWSQETMCSLHGSLDLQPGASPISFLRGWIPNQRSYYSGSEAFWALCTLTPSLLSPL